MTVPPNIPPRQERTLLGQPWWVWAVGSAAVAVVGWVWWRNRGSGGGEKPAPVTQQLVMPTAEGLPTEQYESVLALLRAIQGQSSVIPTTATNPDTSTTTPTTTTHANYPATWYNTYQDGIAGKWILQWLRDRGFTGTWETLRAQNPLLSSDQNAIIPAGRVLQIPGGYGSTVNGTTYTPPVAATTSTGGN